MRATLKNKTVRLVIVLLVGSIAYGLFFRGTKDVQEIIVVHPADFLQQVSVSGTVTPTKDVQIATPQGGVVTTVPVKVGDIVAKGTLLFSIDTKTLRSQLLSARADVDLKRAEIQNTKTSVEQVTREQDALVENAHQTLLSADLVSVPGTSSYTVSPPLIFGRYTGTEGTYQIQIRRAPHDQPSDPTYEVRAFRLENKVVSQILKNEPTPFGTLGLSISFPDKIDDYEDTKWFVTIPNKKGAHYVANSSAYTNALETRMRMITDAKADLAQDSGTSVLEAQLARAEATVAGILADIAERSPTAPFAGIITTVDAKVGETITSGKPAVSMISTGTFQVESYIPEVNIALISVGDTATVTLDAYGADTTFPATVVSIDPAETIKDGVATYRALLQFTDQDQRIKSGMTANIVITTDKRSAVIAIPQGIVISRDGKKFVTVRDGSGTTEREVTTGAVSSSGQVEIRSGLREGDQVINSASPSR